MTPVFLCASFSSNCGLYIVHEIISNFAASKEVYAMASQENHNTTSMLKILFFPFMAQGHLLPLVDMAELFASRGARATILTTPSNASLIEPSIKNPLTKLRVIPFPCCSGLPSGVENLSSVTTPELRLKFFNAVPMLRQPFDTVLQELEPDCVVSDMFLPWTADVAAERGIPRIVFHGTNFFARCAYDSLERCKYLEQDSFSGLSSDTFIIPGLPHEIKLLHSQIDRSKVTDPMKSELFKQIRESESKSYGVVVNSFYELEPDYVQHYRNVVGQKAWHVGPVSLCNQRGTDASIDRDTCISWLDSRRPGSVVYVCFGSMPVFSTNQARELAFVLDASAHPFIWVMRKHSDETLPEDFEERTKEKGLIIRGWAPQIKILNHHAVGCFVTHCGWNSSLEAISAGIQLVTWPLFAEQFFNERLIVDVLKIGVAVGVKEYVSRMVNEREVVGAARIENAVTEVMDGGAMAEERRRRAKRLGETARKAVEVEGSSYVDMGNLLQELMDISIKTG